MKPFPSFLIAVAVSLGGHVPQALGQNASVTLSQQAETRGLVRSSARVEVRTELVASVARAPFGDGMRFKKGDALIEFVCDRYKAELNSAKAAARAAAIELRNKRNLRKHGAAGLSEVQLAGAEAARAGAEVKVRATKVSQCVVTAPFDGRVVHLATRQHEMPTASEPIITVLNDSQLELELVVPSKWLMWLEAGKQFSFLVDETGRTHEAQVTRLGAEVDAVSQTIKVYGTLKNADGRVLAGMSGKAVFPQQGS